MRIKKGDTVQILTGKDAGRSGRVMKVVLGERKVVVDGVNIYKKHLKGDGKKKRSGIIDVAKPLDVSNVMVVCQECGKPSRIGYVVKGSTKTRICKKCGKNPVGKAVDTSKEEKKTKAKATTKTAKKKVTPKKKTSKSTKKS